MTQSMDDPSHLTRQEPTVDHPLKANFHLVIPAFRESARLPRFLEELCGEMEALKEIGVCICVVDDGSGEVEEVATRKVIDSLCSRYSCLRPLLSLPSNRGKGGAVYAGWEQAAPDCHWLGFVDADGSCSTREVARLVQLAKASPEDTALFASRIKMLGHKVDRQLKRHLIGRIYATLVSEVLQVEVYDSQCGLKLVPNELFQRVRDQLSIQGFAFDVDLMMSLLDSGANVKEVPIDWQETPGGKVRLFYDSWRMFRDILSIRAKRHATRSH